MESSGKDQGYSDSSLPLSSARESSPVPDVMTTRRLRDRELLRKRKAEAQEKDSAPWVPREQEKNKCQRRRRGAKRGRGHQPAAEPSVEPKSEPDSQPDAQEEAKPVPSKPAPPEHQEGPPVQTIQDAVSGMQLGVAEKELAARKQDPAGEEEALKPAEAEIPEALNAPLESDHGDDKCSTHVPF